MLKKSTVRLSCLVIAVGLSLAGGPTAMAAEVVTGPTVTAPSP